MIRKLGKQRAASLRLRLNELRAAEDLKDLLFFPGKWEELKGDRRGQWSGRLTANWRLIVEPALGTITMILVREITDYH